MSLPLLCTLLCLMAFHLNLVTVLWQQCCHYTIFLSLCPPIIFSSPGNYVPYGQLIFGQFYYTPSPSKLWPLITKKWKNLVCLWNISLYNSFLFLDCLASLKRSCVYCLQVSCGDFLLSNWLCCHWLLLTIVYWCYVLPVCCDFDHDEWICVFIWFRLMRASQWGHLWMRQLRYVICSSTSFIFCFDFFFTLNIYL